MKLTPGSKYCQCAACGRYFSAVTAFYAHRSGPFTARVCLDPESVGLELKPSGYYGKPGKSPNSGTRNGNQAIV